MNRSPERGDIAPRLQRCFPKRPPRLELLYSSVRPFYFVTFNIHDRTDFLAHDEIHDAFCYFCTRAQEHDIAVGRYVIMPDHIHFFVAFPMTGLTLSEWIWCVEDGARKGIAPTRNTETALAGRVLRSCAAKRGELRTEMGVRADESSPSGALPRARGVAVSGRNRKHPVLAANGMSTDRRGYSDNTEAL
jgi:hypothetical protein